MALVILPLMILGVQVCEVSCTLNRANIFQSFEIFKAEKDVFLKNTAVMIRDCVYNAHLSTDSIGFSGNTLVTDQLVS